MTNHEYIECSEEYGLIYYICKNCKNVLCRDNKTSSDLVFVLSARSPYYYLNDSIHNMSCAELMMISVMK